MELEELTRAELAVLGREWLLHGHLQDRVGMPLVHTGRAREEMEAIAIEEWMAASPVYSLRTQRALHFGAGPGKGDVPTILKNIQLDIGAPPHFMDFRCKVDDANHGEFWLAHCGALLDVEPMGEEYVHGMCHAIEDPTFDATAGATNPRAQVRPLHRPPRVPAGREPHCHWTVVIDPDYPPVDAHPYRAIVEQSLVAGIPTVEPAPNGNDAEPGGWDDYSGEFDPDFELEDLSHRALVTVLQEVAVQSHLLLRGFAVAVAERYGEQTALDLLPQIFTGLAGMTAQRLVPVLELETRDASDIARLLALHPMFWPRTYVDLRIEVIDDLHLRFALGPVAGVRGGRRVHVVLAARRVRRPRPRRDRAGGQPARRVSGRPDAGRRAVRVRRHDRPRRGAGERGGRDRARQDQRRRRVRVHSAASGARGLIRGLSPSRIAPIDVAASETTAAPTIAAA